MTDGTPRCSRIVVLPPRLLLTCPQSPSPVHRQWMSFRVTLTHASSGKCWILELKPAPVFFCVGSTTSSTALQNEGELGDDDVFTVSFTVSYMQNGL